MTRTLRSFLLVSLIGSVAPAWVSADAVSAPNISPTHYEVYIWQENGECLWRIAEKVYGDRHKWPLIYQANRDIIKDPNKVYPGQRLKIPPADTSS